MSVLSELPATLMSTAKLSVQMGLAFNAIMGFMPKWENVKSLTFCVKAPISKLAPVSHAIKATLFPTDNALSASNKTSTVKSLLIVLESNVRLATINST